MNMFTDEVKEKWGGTDAYAEYSEKTKEYSKEKAEEVNAGLKRIMGEFADCMKGGFTSDSPEAQKLVKKLQAYITDNYYTCTTDILKGLGQMYVADERFKNNIDKHCTGTAQYISEAISIF